MPDSGISINTIILAVTTLVTAMTPIMLAVINRRQTRAAAIMADGVERVRTDLKTNTAEYISQSAMAASRVESVRTDLRQQAVASNAQLNAIHTAVNSERSAMLEKLEVMHKAIQLLTADKLSLQQQIHDQGRRSNPNSPQPPFPPDP